LAASLFISEQWKASSNPATEKAKAEAQLVGSTIAPGFMSGRGKIA
jgi:hypothetical protein